MFRSRAEKTGNNPTDTFPYTNIHNLDGVGVVQLGKIYLKITLIVSGCWGRMSTKDSLSPPSLLLRHVMRQRSGDLI